MDTLINVTNWTQLNSYTEKVKRCKQGEIAYITDTNEYAMYNGETWQPFSKEINTDGQALSMNLYELNKMIVSQLPRATEKDIQSFKTILKDFSQTINSNYYMLLCKDISYYTIFTKSKTNELFEDLVIECVQNVGDIITIEKTPEEQAIEIWICNENNDAYCMYLCDCSSLIVRFGTGLC